MRTSLRTLIALVGAAVALAVYRKANGLEPMQATRAEAAHQIVNDSKVVLQYLCCSTMAEPDVMIYPDSGKIGIFSGAAPGGPKDERNFSTFLRADAEVGYYDGEG